MMIFEKEIVQLFQPFLLFFLWLQWLMTDANSPIHDFYPTDFRVDMEGKRNDWEGVVLIPFIDEARLLAASHTVGPAKLSKVTALASGHAVHIFCLDILMCAALKHGPLLLLYHNY